jgi:Histone deacetylase domain
VLIEHGCRVSIINNNFKRAIDVSGEGYVDIKSSKPDQDIKKGNIGNKHKAKVDMRKHQEALIEEIRDARLHLLSLSLQSRTLVLHHPECLEHIPKSSSDWECPDRVTAIMRRLLPDINNTETTGIFPHEVMVSTEFDKAKLDFLSRVHSSDYLSFVNDLSKELTRRNEDSDKVNNEFGMSENRSVVPFTPMIQKAVMRNFGGAVKKDSHSDTSFSAGSLRAARRAAGAVQHAVDS